MTNAAGIGIASVLGGLASITMIVLFFIALWYGYKYFMSVYNQESVRSTQYSRKLGRTLLGLFVTLIIIIVIGILSSLLAIKS